MGYVKEADMEEVWLVVADTYKGASILDEQIKGTKEDAQEFVKAKGNITFLEERSTPLREVYEQKVDGDTREFYVVPIYRHRSYNSEESQQRRSGLIKDTQ